MVKRAKEYGRLVLLLLDTYTTIKKNSRGRPSLSWGLAQGSGDLPLSNLLNAVELS
jgi:hypothetical protein